MRKRPLLIAACVFLTGICYRTYGGGIWLILPVFLLVYVQWPAFWKKQSGKMLVSCIIFFLLFLAGFRKSSLEEDFRNRYLSELQDGEVVTIQGEIYYKEQKTYQIYYYLKNTYIQSENQAISCNQVIAYMSQDLYPIGTTIIAKGTVSFWDEARNEGNFDAKAFYSSQQIDFAVDDLTVKNSIPPDITWQEWLYQFRCRLKNVIIEAIGEKEGGVLAGMLLGDKSELDQEVKEAYKNAGISHVLAISALHISIFASGIYGFLRKRGMGYWGAGVLSFLFLMGYATMTGNGISTQRAVMMFLITVVGATFGRSSDLLNSLGAAILFLLWENPRLMEYAGFQFSIAAVLSIGIVSEVRWKKEMTGQTQDSCKGQMRASRKGQAKDSQNSQAKGIELKKRLADGFILSGFIQLGTLPLTAYHYFEVPVYSVVLNVFLLPLMSYLLPLGAFGSVVGLFFSFPAKLILLPCKGILWLYEKSCSLMLQLPFSQWITGQPEIWQMVLYYLLLFLGVLFWYTGKKRRWIMLAEGVATGFCLFGSSSLQPELSILDVGQGDGIFIYSQSGISMFIDGGSTDVKNVGTYRILPFLKSKGVRQIDYWFVSHADQDHISGLLEVLESGYSIENVVFSSAIPRDEAWESVVNLAEEFDSNLFYLNQGDSLVMGQEIMTCLFPGEDGSSDRNELSMVLLWESGEFQGLFTGDISEEEEKLLLSQERLGEVNFYKAAHHGSNSSNSSAFLEYLSPEITVISCGKDNSYGHPGEEALKHIKEAGSEIFYTMESGQITVKRTEEGMRVYEFRK